MGWGKCQQMKREGNKHETKSVCKSPKCSFRSQYSRKNNNKTRETFLFVIKHLLNTEVEKMGGGNNRKTHTHCKNKRRRQNIINKKMTCSNIIRK